VQSDLLERLRDESLQLARKSFDSGDAGISANLCDEAIDEIERLNRVIGEQVASTIRLSLQVSILTNERDEARARSSQC
jgi:hypothetical protein